MKTLLLLMAAAYGLMAYAGQRLSAAGLSTPATHRAPASTSGRADIVADLDGKGSLFRVHDSATKVICFVVSGSNGPSALQCFPGGQF